MKINAIIESKDGGTLVLDFPRSIYDVYEKLQSVGIRQSPHQITLSDEDGADVRVKLYSKDEVGKHLLLTLNEQNSLADANMLAFMVDNAKTDFRSKLEQNLLHDQYGSMQEVTDAIKQMLAMLGHLKLYVAFNLSLETLISRLKTFSFLSNALPMALNRSRSFRLYKKRLKQRPQKSRGSFPRILPMCLPSIVLLRRLMQRSKLSLSGCKRFKNVPKLSKRSWMQPSGRTKKTRPEFRRVFSRT